MLIQAWIIQIRGHWKAPNSKNRWQVLVVLTAWNSKKEFSYRQVHKKFRNLQWMSIRATLMSIRATLFALNSDQRNTVAFGRQKEGLSTSWNLPRNSHTRQAAKSLPLSSTSPLPSSSLSSLPDRQYDCLHQALASCFLDGIGIYFGSWPTTPFKEGL